MSGIRWRRFAWSEANEQFKLVQRKVFDVESHWRIRKSNILWQAQKQKPDTFND